MVWFGAIPLTDKVLHATLTFNYNVKERDEETLGILYGDHVWSKN